MRSVNKWLACVAVACFAQGAWAGESGKNKGFAVPEVMRGIELFPIKHHRVPIKV